LTVDGDNSELMLTSWIQRLGMWNSLCKRRTYQRRYICCLAEP